MSVITAPCGQASNQTGTAQVATQAVHLIGFYVNSTTGGTIAIKNGTSSTGAAISGTITPAIGFHHFPATCELGLYITVANTLNVTLFFVPA